jgi:hypothetical protein
MGKLRNNRFEHISADTDSIHFGLAIAGGLSNPFCAVVHDRLAAAGNLHKRLFRWRWFNSDSDLAARVKHDLTAAGRLISARDRAALLLEWHRVDCGHFNVAASGHNARSGWNYRCRESGRVRCCLSMRNANPYSIPECLLRNGCLSDPNPIPHAGSRPDSGTISNDTSFLCCRYELSGERKSGHLAVGCFDAILGPRSDRFSRRGDTVKRCASVRADSLPIHGRNRFDHRRQHLHGTMRPAW